MWHIPLEVAELATKKPAELANLFLLTAPHSKRAVQQNKVLKITLARAQAKARAVPEDATKGAHRQALRQYSTDDRQ